MELPGEIATRDRPVAAEGERVAPEKRLQACRQIGLRLGFSHSEGDVHSYPAKGIDQTLEVEEPGDQITL